MIPSHWGERDDDDAAGIGAVLTAAGPAAADAEAPCPAMRQAAAARSRHVPTRRAPDGRGCGLPCPGAGSALTNLPATAVTVSRNSFAAGLPGRAGPPVRFAPRPRCRSCRSPPCHSLVICRSSRRLSIVSGSSGRARRVRRLANQSGLFLRRRRERPRGPAVRRTPTGTMCSASSASSPTVPPMAWAAVSCAAVVSSRARTSSRPRTAIAAPC